MPDRLFVLMPFAPVDVMQSVYNTIAKVAEAEGLTCERSDTPGPPLSHRIDDWIWGKILEASIIVVDLTDTNPNVFFELGVCHLLQKRLIYISQTNNIPFYVKKQFVHLYDASDPEALYKILQDEIRKGQRQLQTSGVAENIIRTEASQFAARMEGLSGLLRKRRYRYDIPRGVGNTTFSRSIGQLPPAWCYDALSQMSFWSQGNIQSTKFLDICEAVARRGVAVRRVMMLRATDLADEEVLHLLRELHRTDQRSLAYNRREADNEGGISTRVHAVDQTDEQLQNEHLHIAIIYHRESEPEAGTVLAPCYNAMREFNAIELDCARVADARQSFDTHWRRARPVEDFVDGPS